jgi:predicted nucleotidyltransferase
MSVFTPQEREQLRETLVANARADPQIVGAAHLGSAAVGREDRWSDIDLALCLSPDVQTDHVIEDWTKRMYRIHNAVTHLDAWWKTTLYRVFLLENTLQVDLSFWSPTEFGATGPMFRLVFGTAIQRPEQPQSDGSDLVGMAWLYALHARSSIARGRVWQAEYMLSALRDHILALACLRHQLSAHQGRGMDELPEEFKTQLSAALVVSLEMSELERAFRVTINALCAEIEYHDPELATRLVGLLKAMLL